MTIGYEQLFGEQHEFKTLFYILVDNHKYEKMVGIVPNFDRFRRYPCIIEDAVLLIGIECEKDNKTSITRR